MNFSNYAAQEIRWGWGDSGTIPYRVEIDGATLEILVGDFPEESMYTLLVNGRSVGESDSWPSAWIRPGN